MQYGHCVTCATATHQLLRLRRNRTFSEDALLEAWKAADGRVSCTEAHEDYAILLTLRCSENHNG
jgi:hypothetical protein